MTVANLDRQITTTTTGTPPAEALKGRYVAAICPSCGGWTMFHGDPSSSTGQSWTSMAAADGDIIVYWKSTISLGTSCARSDEHPEKNCDHVVRKRR